jgi:hypothetical protein
MPIKFIVFKFCSCRVILFSTGLKLAWMRGLDATKFGRKRKMAEKEVERNVCVCGTKLINELLLVQVMWFINWRRLLKFANTAKVPFYISEYKNVNSMIKNYCYARCKACYSVEDGHESKVILNFFWRIPSCKFLSRFRQRGQFEVPIVQYFIQRRYRIRSENRSICKTFCSCMYSCTGHVGLGRNSHKWLPIYGYLVYFQASQQHCCTIY